MEGNGLLFSGRLSPVDMPKQNKGHDRLGQEGRTTNEKGIKIDRLKKNLIDYLLCYSTMVISYNRT